MSEDTRSSDSADELGVNAAEVRRYRLGFVHAVALLVALSLLPLGAGMVASLIHLGHDTFWRDTGARPIAFVDEGITHRPFVEELQEPPVNEAPDFWSRTKSYGIELLTSVKRSLSEAQRLHNEETLTAAFAELDQSDPRQARKFLAAYQNDPYAISLGYIAAVQRAVAERRLYVSDNIMACGKCWCWRETPARLNDTAATQ